jgi:hypothetical protein
MGISDSDIVTRTVDFAISRLRRKIEDDLTTRSHPHRAWRRLPPSGPETTKRSNQAQPARLPE